MKNLDNPQAFPFQGLGENGMPFGRPKFGMTLRDYFAVQALSGLIAASKVSAVCNSRGTEVLYSESAYMFADAMLAEREKSQ